jgi:hypothetical protein
MKHIAYGKTDQFRTAVTSVIRGYNYVGVDENGEAIYDRAMKKPKLKFKGTIKLHGTNAGICYNDEYGLYTQSKNGKFKLSQVDSHMGFTFFVKQNEQVFLDLMMKIKSDNNIDTSINTITVYGEWAGGSIQKIVAISELPKSFYMFGVKISKPSDPDFTNYWVPCDTYRFEGHDKIWNLFEFKTYEVEVDFENPGIAQNRFLEIIDEVEAECPVASQLGVKGIGEGVVFVGEYKGAPLKFKIKGEKHSKSKVKTVKSVDTGKIALCQEIADKVTPSWRLEQFFNEITDQGKDLNRKHLSGYIRLVIKDIMEEDLDIISDAGLEPKDINKYVSTITRDYFFMMESEIFNTK